MTNLYDQFDVKGPAAVPTAPNGPTLGVLAYKCNSQNYQTDRQSITNGFQIPFADDVNQRVRR